MSLRRADWRFLLPGAPGGCFRHLLLLGGPTGLDRELVEAAAAARVSTVMSPGDLADAVVVLAGAGVSLRDAARQLAPGGVAYWEIDRRGWRGLTRTPRSIDRHLEQVGLRQTGTYWVIPDFMDARRYLPLDRPAAVEWFFETRFVASTPARVALHHLVAAMIRRAGQTLATVVPCCAVVAASPSRGFTPVAALGHADLPVAVRDPEVRPVLFTSGQDDGSRVVILPFPAGAREPAVVIKIARRPDFDGHTAREQATLTQLRAALSPELRQTLPEPLGSHGSGLARAFLEKPVPGRMLAASTGRWRAPAGRQVEDLRLAADWLARFHAATLVRRERWGAEAMDRWIEPSLRQYDRTFGVEPEEERFFAAVRHRAAALAGHELPIVWAHNDFNPWHVYRSGSAVAVIDWEFGEEDVTRRQGPALSDLIYFVNHWLILARGLQDDADQLHAFSELFLGAPARDVRCSAARAAFADYMTRLELDAGFLPLLVAYTWIERAVDRELRLRALGSSSVEHPGDNQFTRRVRVLARGVSALFGEESGATR